MGELRVSDPKAIRALAHPTRLALLEILAGEGQATATRCAELSGHSVASCSFHLRTLAKHGFIEVVPGPGREKPWRLTELRQHVDADSRAAAAAFDDFFLRHELARLRAWQERSHEEPEEWRRASVMGGATAWLTAAELAEVKAELDGLVERWFTPRARGPHAGDRRPVRLFTATSLGLYDPEAG
jgi:hypothetical protein